RRRPAAVTSSSDNDNCAATSTRVSRCPWLPVTRRWAAKPACRLLPLKRRAGRIPASSAASVVAATATAITRPSGVTSSAIVGSHGGRARVRRRGGLTGLDPSIERGQLRFGLTHGRALPQASHHAREERHAVAGEQLRVGQGAQRHPYVDRVAGLMAVEAGRGHPDDRAVGVAYTQRAADGGGVLLELPNPETMADHGGTTRAARGAGDLVVTLRKQSAVRGREAQHGEIAAGHEAAADIGRTDGAGERHLEKRRAADGEHARERVLPPAQLFEDGVEED